MLEQHFKELICVLNAINVNLERNNKIMSALADTINSIDAQVEQIQTSLAAFLAALPASSVPPDAAAALTKLQSDVATLGNTLANAANPPTPRTT